MYYFKKESDLKVFGRSSVYSVYTTDNDLVTYITIGYEPEYDIYYFTEYLGYCERPNHNYFRIAEQFLSALYDFTELFNYIDASEIFWDETYYTEYKDQLPPLTRENLWIYEGSGEIVKRSNQHFIMPDDDILAELAANDILDDTYIKLEYFDEDEGVKDIDLNFLHTYTCFDVGTELDGYYMQVKDWDKIKRVLNNEIRLS